MGGEGVVPPYLAGIGRGFGGIYLRVFPNFDGLSTIIHQLSTVLGGNLVYPKLGYSPTLGIHHLF